jgi:hypothetical protein
MAFLDGLAGWIARRRMATPAVLFLESVKPLNFIGSQALFFFEPVVKAFVGGAGYTRFATIMERRESVEIFLQRIEAADRAERDREDTARKERKEKEKKR